jgi:hypothetical protein
MRLATQSSLLLADMCRRANRVLLLLWLLTSAASVRAEDQAHAPSRTLSPWLAGGLWTIAQLIPSPLFVVGSDSVGGGVRWQLTPLVYSFGVAARPLRSFVIEPVARHCGAVELFVSPEWACCTPRRTTNWLARTGARVYLPLVLRGESLAVSFGGSYAFASPHGVVAGELGFYTLSSIFGLTVTVAPWLTGREVIGALSFHYF